MKLFVVPIDSEAYTDVIKLKELSPREIFYSELFEKEYSRKDYDDAEAFVINFINMSYGYADINVGNYFEKCCERGTLLLKQVKDYEISKSQLRNKDFAQTDFYRFVISEKVKHELNLIGVDDSIFRPVWERGKHGSPGAFQITPINILPPIAKVNRWKSYIGCKYCNKKLYNWEDNAPFYISQEAADSLQDFNITLEQVGNLCTPLYIVNRKIYTFLKSRYKRMYFEPIFVK